MKCPKCTGETTHLEVGGVELDRCTRCQGIWFDRRELDRVLDKLRAGEALPPSSSSPLSEKLDRVLGSCPRCQVPLEQTESVAVAGLLYDGCPQCGGAWLDGGELEEIAQDPETSAIAAFFAKFEGV
jgi:Zn-finger nucleic acid-binding protein